MVEEIIVKFTNLCNESCSHCVFRSGPRFKTHLTPELARQINGWIPRPHITNISSMGGEITLIPNYPELLQILYRGIDQGGLMTNGVFVKSDQAFKTFVQTIKSLRNRHFTVRISQTQYHSPEGYGARAYEKLTKIFKNVEGRFVQIVTHLSPVVPLGRAFDNNIGIDYWRHHPQLGAYCEVDKQPIFVDERGFACRCLLGKSRHKHISEDSFDTVKKEIVAWRQYRIERGMNCLSCAENDIGYCESEIIEARVPTILHCTAGNFNGEV